MRPSKLRWDATVGILFFLMCPRACGDAASCAEMLLNVNLFEKANDPAQLGLYTDCTQLLRQGLDKEAAPKTVHVAGQHFPTLITLHHREPPVVYDGVRQDPEVPHFFLTPAFDLNIGHAIKMVGTHNPHQSYFMQLLLRPGDAYVDVGANLGAYTVPMASRVGVGGLVIAFEPFIHTFQALCANIALNGLLNVRAVNAALGNRTTRTTVHRPHMGTFNTLSAMKVNDQVEDQDVAAGMGVFYDGTEDVQVWSLDNFLNTRQVNLGQRPLRMIKIDVEGMEVEVVRGAFATIRRLLPLVWAENVPYFESNGKDVSFLAAMQEVGYTCMKAEHTIHDLLCSSISGEGHQPT